MISIPNFSKFAVFGILVVGRDLYFRLIVNFAGRLIGYYGQGGCGMTER
jgi:hypothetical protein